MDTRICCACKQEKPIIDFSSGSYRCKGCDMKRLLEWTEKQGKPLQMYHRAKSNAKRRGIKWNISYKEHRDWISGRGKFCYYCKTPLDFNSPRNHNSPTIDRIDNGKYYTTDNIKLSCLRCNIIKGSWFTEQQMLEIATKYLME